MLRIYIVIIFLAGFILFVNTFLRRSKGCALSSFGIGLIIMGIAGLIFWRISRCDSRFVAPPNEFRIAGHIKAGNAYPDNYLVILFRDNDEFARNPTHNGRFEADRMDQENHGYFELVIPNEDQLTSCSMRDNFMEWSWGRSFLPWPSLTPYLWHNLGDVEIGTSKVITLDGAKRNFTLVVLPTSVDNYPAELSSPSYHTYLDGSGQVAINLPIKTFTTVGNLSYENSDPSGYLFRADPLASASQAAQNPVLPEVRDAWVVSGTDEIIDDGKPGQIIDWNNCDGSKPPSASIPISLTYIQEVQFRQDAGVNYDLGIIASYAAQSQSLGFTQGQLKTINTSIDVEAPAGAHRKYQVMWQKVWKTGYISIASGLNPIQVPFRALHEMKAYAQHFDVECPETPQ